MTESSIDDALSTAKVLIVVGPGGVGKTTMSAALAARAAMVDGRQVLVVTVDPSKRLAEMFGIDSATHTEPTEVPLEQGDGRLWAYLVDMSRSWDDLVRDTAPDPKLAHELLANPLYRTLTTRFAQSHDYIALDHLVSIANDPSRPIDLVVVDTPPSVHVLDILDAPGRMIQFFDSWLLKWLIAPYRSRMGQIAAKPFLLVADRLLGARFVREMAEFFWMFSKLRRGFVKRVEGVQEILTDESTEYVVIRTSDPSQRARADELIVELAARGNDAPIVITNRALPPSLLNLSPEDLVKGTKEPSLRSELEALVAQAADESHSDQSAVVEWRPDAVTSTVGLAELFGPIGAP